MVLGELVPKQLALRRPERSRPGSRRPLAWLARITSPVVWLLEQFLRAVLRLFGLHRAAAPDRDRGGAEGAARRRARRPACWRPRSAT